MADRIIEKKTWNPGRLVTVVVIAGLALAALLAIMNRSGTTRLTVDSSRMSISRVTTGEFREYYPFDGKVVPENSVYLDVEEGGRVEEIYTEGGKWVEKGTPILKFSNISVQRNSIQAETDLLRNLDQISNTQFDRAQNSLAQKDTLLDMNYAIQELEKKFKRYQDWMKSGNSSLTREEFEKVRDELQYRKDKRDLMKERIRQEDLLSAKQLEQANESIVRMNKSLDLLSKVVESLEVKAPISGQLSSISAEIGQNINPGTRIGQIDVLDKFKVRVTVDQFYISRIDEGTEGRFLLDGKDYPVTVRKIYPEIVNDAFQVDVDFASPVPDGIRRGQTLTVELNFGAASQALMVRKGGFYQQTGGRWAYVVAPDGKTASKVNIRLGRQNPQFVEVLEGLKEGDRVITSGYDTFNEMDQLVFSEPLDK